MGRKRIIVFFIVALSGLQIAGAQERLTGFDFNLAAGVNLGATTPVPIPGALDITGYNPRFNPTLGANAAWYFTPHWGIGAGVGIDWKGMKVHTKVTDVHLSIDVPGIGTLTGYVTGKNTTKVNALYLVQPVYAIYRFANPRWNVRAGIYLAETLSREFEGDFRDVSIVVQSPVSQVREIAYATLDYSDHTRKFDVGLLAGGEFRASGAVGIFAQLTYGLRPYFSASVPIEFAIRNVYFSVGATFRVF